MRATANSPITLRLSVIFPSITICKASRSGSFHVFISASVSSSSLIPSVSPSARNIKSFFVRHRIRKVRALYHSPMSGRQPGFFLQFSFGRFQWVNAGTSASLGNFPTPLVERVTPLPNQPRVALVVYSNNTDGFVLEMYLAEIPLPPEGFITWCSSTLIQRFS